MRVSWLWLILLACLAACSAPVTREATPPPAPLAEEPRPVMPSLNVELFQAPADLPEPEHFLTLESDQAEAFVAYYSAPERSDTAGHHRLRDYLLKRLFGFRYHADTLSASDALNAGQGNCMSLAALTYALAQLVDLELEFQQVNTPPLFDRHAGHTISSDHVRTRVYKPEDEDSDRLILRRASIIIDYFPNQTGIGADEVSVETFIAMFYRNLAAEALLGGDLSRSFFLAQRALSHQADHPDALNILAILHKRQGDRETADALYSYARRLHPQRLDLLLNHEGLLRSMGQTARAEALARLAEQLRDPNPFRWLDQGQAARERGDSAAALRWYAYAIERAPYLHQAYWQTATLYAEQARWRKAIEFVEQALSHSYRASDQLQYQQALERWRQQAGLAEP